MGSSSQRPPALLHYLQEQNFLPRAERGWLDPVERTWYDRDAGSMVIRVVCAPGDECRVIALAPRGVCLYQALFSPGTPHSVIIATIEAALAQAGPADAAAAQRAGAAGRARPGTPAASLTAGKRGRDNDR
jgi:hypothetical protein